MQINLIDLLIIVLKHKIFIAVSTLIVSVMVVIYSLLATQYWTSTAVIIPVEAQSTSIPASLSFLGLGSSLLGGAFKVESVELMSILRSRSFTEKVINEFSLIDYLELDPADSLLAMQLAVMGVRKKICGLELDEQTGIIRISIETRDKYFSRDIADYYWREIDRYNRETRMTKGKQNRLFIGERLVEVEENIRILSKELTEFKKKHNIIELTAQTTGAIENYSNLAAEMLQVDMEIEYIKKMVEENSTEVEMLLHKREILKRKIIDLERYSGDDFNLKYVVNIDNLPDLALSYADFLMNIEIQKKVYEFLYPQFEAAKIEEIKDMPTIEVIDSAVPAGLRSRPKRARICISVFVIAVFTFSALAFVIEKTRTLNQDRELSDKIDELKKYIRF